MLHIVTTLLGHAADSPTLSHFPPSSGPDRKEPVLTLSFYVVFMVHHIKPCSIDNYLSGIVSQLEPHFPSVCAARNSDLVHRTMGAPCNTSLSLSALVSPFPGWILIMPSPSSHILWHTMTSASQAHHAPLCIFGLLWVGKLVWPDSPDLQVHSQLTSHLSVFCDVTSFAFAVPHRKSDDHFEGSHICISASTLSPDPRGLFLQYLGYHDVNFPLHFFLWVHVDGSVPMRAWFLRCFHIAFPSSVLSGHSLHAGGATLLAAAGVLPAQIQAIGHWSSSAWQHYIKKNPTLLQTLLFHG